MLRRTKQSNVSVCILILLTTLQLEDENVSLDVSGFYGHLLPNRFELTKIFNIVINKLSYILK